MKIERSAEEVVHQNTKLVAIQVAIAYRLLCDHPMKHEDGSSPPSMNALAGFETCPGLKRMAVLTCFETEQLQSTTMPR